MRARVSADPEEDASLQPAVDVDAVAEPDGVEPDGVEPDDAEPAATTEAGGETDVEAEDETAADADADTVAAADAHAEAEAVAEEHVHVENDEPAAAVEPAVEFSGPVGTDSDPAPGTAVGGPSGGQVADVEVEHVGGATTAPQPTASVDGSAPASAAGGDGAPTGDISTDGGLKVAATGATAGGNVNVVPVKVGSAGGPGSPAGPSESLSVNPADAVAPDRPHPQGGSPEPGTVDDVPTATRTSDPSAAPSPRPSPTAAAAAGAGAAAAGVSAAAAGGLSDAEFDAFVASSLRAAGPADGSSPPDDPSSSAGSESTGGGSTGGGSAGGASNAGGGGDPGHGVPVGTAPDGGASMRADDEAGNFEAPGAAAGSVVFFDDFAAWVNADGDGDGSDALVGSYDSSPYGRTAAALAGAAGDPLQDESSRESTGFAARRRWGGGSRPGRSRRIGSDANMIKMFVAVVAAGLLAALLLTLGSNDGLAEAADNTVAPRRAAATPAPSPQPPTGLVGASATTPGSGSGTVDGVAGVAPPPIGDGSASEAAAGAGGGAVPEPVEDLPTLAPAPAQGAGPSSQPSAPRPVPTGPVSAPTTRVPTPTRTTPAPPLGDSSDSSDDPQSTADEDLDRRDDNDNRDNDNDNRGNDNDNRDNDNDNRDNDDNDRRDRDRDERRPTGWENRDDRSGDSNDRRWLPTWWYPT